MSAPAPAPKAKKVGKKKKREEGVSHPKQDDFVCELEEQAVTVDNNGKIYEVLPWQHLATNGLEF